MGLPNFTEFLDDLPVAIIILDSDYNIAHWSRHLEQWSKINHSDVQGLNIFERFENINRESYKNRLENILKGGPPTNFSSLLHNYFVPILIKNNVFASQSCTAKGYKDQSTGEKYIILTIQDMTEIDKRNQQIKKIQADLMTKLKLSNEYLDEFTGIVAHDLKAPLRGIRNYIKFIFEDHVTTLPDSAGETLKNINYLANSMENLIKKMFEFSRLGRIDFVSKDVDSKLLVQTVASPLALVMQNQNIDIQIDSNLPRINCDEVRISEVFHNLIVNSIRYNSKTEKQIKISHTLEGNKIVFAVADNGDGIDKKYFKKIFRLFSRLSLSNDDSTGAGLSFVKKIIERSGGEIWVESTLGEGSTFFFSLPK